LFCGHNILTESVFVTQLSINAGISVGRIVWVMTNCRFMSDIYIYIYTLLTKQHKLPCPLICVCLTIGLNVTEDSFPFL
jgi:hypothetical protein